MTKLVYCIETWMAMSLASFLRSEFRDSFGVLVVGVGVVE
jgi:hypothetical protein